MQNIEFIDLFAGIGGFHLALHSLGGSCVFSAEINEQAAHMYEANYGMPALCDVTKINEATLPRFDVLCAGFPCQAFSRAGHQKGFDDTRGTLFFDLCRIINLKKPPVIFLENVKNLINHDGGKTLRVIVEHLEDLNYWVSFKVLNAKDFGVAQNRERIIIVANRKDLYDKPFDFSLVPVLASISIESILEPEVDEKYYLQPSDYTLIENPVLQKKTHLKFVGYRNKNTRINGVLPNTLQLSRTHKQFNRIYSVEGTHPTISSSEVSGRYFVLLKNGRVRRLTLTECYRLMGFPDNFIKTGSISHQYARIGNSVCVPMIKMVGEQIIKQLF